jgi:hypothetical protein
VRNSGSWLQPTALEADDIPDVEVVVREHIQRRRRVVQVSMVANAVHKDMKAGHSIVVGRCCRYEVRETD